VPEKSADFQLDTLPPLDAIEAALERKRQTRILKWFPETGPYRRELYVQHMEFFRIGAIHRERLFLAANRVGKTICGAYEMALHLTGMYDELAPWWEGKRFDCPVVAWACNKTATDCRDINQKELLGDHGQPGTGMIPASMIVHTKPKPSVPDAVELVYVKNKFHGQSTLVLKSYDQGREKFQGRAVHAIWADEEVPDDIYTEMLLRTMTTDGTIFLTYTPIQGLTPVTVDFLTNSVNKESLPLKFTKRDEKTLQRVMAGRR